MGVENSELNFHKPEFQRRCIQNWMIIGLMYSLFYMSRYNFFGDCIKASGDFWMDKRRPWDI